LGKGSIAVVTILKLSRPPAYFLRPTQSTIKIESKIACLCYHSSGSLARRSSPGALRKGSGLHRRMGRRAVGVRLIDQRLL
jgi:hypothetical protein